MVEFRKREDFEAWLKDKPRGWAIVLATRTALRVTPLLAKLIERNPAVQKRLTGIVLPVFRATALPWVACKYPTLRETQIFVQASFAVANSALSAVSAADAIIDATAATARILTDAVYAVTESARPVNANSAGFAIFRASAARPAVWEAVSDDANLIESGIEPEALAVRALWPNGVPAWANENWESLKTSLLLQTSESIREENWQVWTDWYEARLHGRDPWPEEVETACALIPDEIWKKGPAAANAEIKRIRDEWAEKQKAQSGHIAKSPDEIRTALANVASPSPILRDGKIDVGPNPIFDKAQYSDDLPGLPERQRILIRVILNGLPRNAPAYLLSSLHEYSDHLNQRGVEPIVGVLKDMGAIIEAAVTARNAADEWLAEEQRAAFDRFNNNHERLIEHFPLDKQREDTYANTPVEESKIEAGALHRPLEDVAEKAREAAQAGLVTDVFVKVVQAMADNGKIIESLPPETGSVPEIQVSSDDRIIAVPKRISAKKRALLNQTGFAARSVEVIAQSASIASIVPGAALLESLRNALTVLMRAFL